MPASHQRACQALSPALKRRAAGVRQCSAPLLARTRVGRGAAVAGPTAGGFLRKVPAARGTEQRAEVHRDKVLTFVADHTDRFHVVLPAVHPLTVPGATHT